jgi:hypothetical protein
MARLLVFLLLILLTVGSGAGYLLLDRTITAGERELVAGQKQLREGEAALDEGKEELAAGKRALTEGKEEYEEARKNPFLVWIDKLANQERGFKEGRAEIAEGEQELADGRSAVQAGETRVEEGRVEISEGRAQLRLAQWARLACAVMVAVSGSLAVVLGVCWRHSLFGMFRQARTG